MGNDGIKKSSFEQHNWRNIEEKNNRIILYNDITMKSVQKHEASLDCDQGEAITLCKWRESLAQDCGVVDLYQYGIKSSGMCTKQSQLYVITERIHLLSEIGSFSKPEAFIILRDVASGLRILFSKFGHFNPRPNIIGINSEGRAKIWTNENFALTQPIKQTIPVQESELAIVNNLIRLLEAKTYRDHSLPIDYPRNLDLTSVINYVNKVFSSLQGFEVDRVYIDRAEFTKKYNQLRQRTEKDQLSRMIATEAQRKLKQIQALHENLRLQQAELARKQKQLKLQNQYQEELLRQQQAKRQLQIQRQSELQMQLQKRSELLTDNSQGKLLRGTASSYRESINTRVNSATMTQIQNIVHQNQVPLQQINNGTQPNIYRQNLATYVQPQGMPPLPKGAPTQNFGVKQVYPSRLIQNDPNSIPNKRPQTPDRKQKFKKEIEMVDSMILMQEEDPSEQNKKYIESRIITYPV